MTKKNDVEYYLMEKVQSYIAKEIWQKISTELDLQVGSGGPPDGMKRFPWMIKRAKELLKEYFDEEETKDKVGVSGSDEA